MFAPYAFTMLSHPDFREPRGEPGIAPRMDAMIGEFQKLGTPVLQGLANATPGSVAPTEILHPTIVRRNNVKFMQESGEGCSMRSQVRPKTDCAAGRRLHSYNAMIWSEICDALTGTSTWHGVLLDGQDKQA